MSKRKKGRHKTWLEKQREKSLARQQQRQVSSPGSPPARPSGQIVHVQQQTQTWNSPTLPPQVLADYALIHPDAPERFLRYMEKEQDNRHGQQAIVLHQVGRAQTYTFCLSGLGLVVACVCIVAGQAAGFAIAAAAVIPLLQAVWQRHKEAKSEREEAKQLPKGE